MTRAYVHWADVLTILLIVFQGMLAVIVVARPEDLGLPKLALNWLVILNVGVGLLLNQLKALGQPPSTTSNDPAKPGTN